jgi:hypothetical protein
VINFLSNQKECVHLLHIASLCSSIFDRMMTEVY